MQGFREAASEVAHSAGVVLRPPFTPLLIWILLAFVLSLALLMLTNTPTTYNQHCFRFVFAHISRDLMYIM